MKFKLTIERRTNKKSKRNCNDFFSPYSYDLRGQSDGDGSVGRHWRANRTVGERAHFKFYETGMFSETGAPVIDSYLAVGPLRIEDRGVYR